MTSGSSVRWAARGAAAVAPVEDVTPPDRALRYLALVEKVASQLLSAAEPAGMVDELFALIHDELRLDVFFNYRFADGRLELEAHGGLSPAQAEAAAVVEIGSAVCGCVARDRVAVHATAIQASDEAMVAFVKAVGLDTYACTPLVQGGTLIGTLGFGRRWADRFEQDELHFLHTISHYVALAKHRLRVENDLRQAVEAKERMLQELNHRVRNSLQLVIGMLALEARGTEIGEARAAIGQARDRILVVAAVHQRLYEASALTGIDVGALLGDLVGDLGQAAGVAIAFTREGSLILPVEIAVSLALTVDHILRDRGRAGPVRIAMNPIEGGGTRIAFAGLLPPADRPDRILAALLRQLRATLGETAGGATALDLPARREMPH